MNYNINRHATALPQYDSHMNYNDTAKSDNQDFIFRMLYYRASKVSNYPYQSSCTECLLHWMCINVIIQITGHSVTGIPQDVAEHLLERHRQWEACVHATAYAGSFVSLQTVNHCQSSGFQQRFLAVRELVSAIQKFITQHFIEWYLPQCNNVCCMNEILRWTGSSVIISLLRHKYENCPFPFLWYRVWR